MKRILIFIFAILLLTSCNENEPQENEIDSNVIAEDVQASLPDDVPIVEEPAPIQPAEDTRKTEISYTNGLPCTPEEKTVRPIAVMYNNNKFSYPQNEISKADIVYECNAEGGLTRLMAIFSQWKDLDDIGSIRSARDYFISLSESHEAVYVHAGGSPSAYEKLINGKIDYIDGVNMNNLPSGTFYRDSYRLKHNGYEHSLMTNGEKLLNASDNLGYDGEYSADFSSPMKFNSEFTKLGGACALSVTLNHSTYITVGFDYDDESGRYFKTSFKSPHIDGSNGQQLSFTNVIVLFVNETVLDTEGRLGVDLTSGGKGYFITGGEYVDIEWSRKTDDSPFVFTVNGEDLKLNPGKTHITLFDKNSKDKVIIK